jgi:hypothetical protein
MTHFALASELHRLSPADRSRPDLHIICDDGDWTEAQITAYINQWSGHSILHDESRPDDWSNPEPLV